MLMEIADTLKTTLDPRKTLESLRGDADPNNNFEGLDKSPVHGPEKSSENGSENDSEKKSARESHGERIENSDSVKTSRDGKTPLIKLTDVWKIYQMGEVEFAALKGIDLEIYEGEFVVVLGPSGSGKSTLMNLLGCLDVPSQGTVSLNSRDISRMEESELAQIRGQMIGFIFQSFNLIPTLNTLENVTLPLEFQEENPGKARERAEYLLDVVGLSDKHHNLPSQLSGGQRQRVAIARSLAVNPPVLLADEPTGNLDSKTGDYILEFLDELRRKEGKTIIIVTHDMTPVQYATRVVHIKDGEIEKIEEVEGNYCKL
ncbi:MAG: ABC transporter ATP-binding protein [Methanosarcinaceae archaeon]